jgi:hypothetical protein
MTIAKRKSMDEIFGKKNGKLSSGISSFELPDFTSRNFPGSTTKKKRGWYGPALSFATTPDMDSSLSGASAPVEGGAGAPIGESADIKFRTFIESLKTEANASTISTIMEGYDAIMEARKHDPKAEVRNKKSPVFPADSKHVNDDKDHFPIGSEAQARNALARVNQYTKAPKWAVDITLKAMKKKVANAVKKHYPSIEVTEESYN